MPIDPKFAVQRTAPEMHDGHAVWVDRNSSKLGIHGTNVAVDFDSCTSDGSCLNVCPVAVFSWIEISSNVEKLKKPDPVNESSCVYCFACQKVCPVEAILISQPDQQMTSP